MNKTLLEIQEGVLYFTSLALSMISTISSVASHSVQNCQEAALTRRIAWRRSGGGVELGPSGKQLHPAAPELTAWRERLTDSSQ